MNILVIGDIMLDINYISEITRSAPEANIPIYNILEEIKDIIDIDLLSNNVAIIVVEDPEINRTTLYDEMLTIFQEKIDLYTKKGGRRYKRKVNTKRSRKNNKKMKTKKVKTHIK
jgi:hypothetical protein